MAVKVSIDASGGDHGIPVTIPAGIKALRKFKDLEIVFVGNQDIIESELSQNKSANQYKNRYHIVPASQVVLMDEAPSAALRKKKDSSMRVAINLVKDKQVDACVSAGNTGALMAISRFVLKTIKGVDRPAIMGRMPTMHGHTHMLDLGANVDSKPQALIEFATMGSTAVEYTEKINAPTVGLLNIGEEEVKGNEKIKQTAELFKETSLNYVGFVEGDDIYKGTVDLVVCDGYEGNIALKASEGVASMMAYYLKKAFSKNWITKLMAVIASPVLKDFKSSLDPGKYNGASLLGLQGVVVKSHGSADIDAFLSAIEEAYLEANAKITEKIASKISKELSHG